MSGRDRDVGRIWPCFGRKCDRIRRGEVYCVASGSIVGSFESLRLNLDRVSRPLPPRGACSRTLSRKTDRAQARPHEELSPMSFTSFDLHPDLLRAIDAL